MASPVSNLTHNEGSALNVSLSNLFSDPEGDSITLNLTGLPAWATYNAATKTITGTPGAGAVNQSHTITVNGSSTGGNASSTFVLTVNDAPDLTAGGGGNAIYAAGGGAVAIDPAITLADAEGNFNGGTLRVNLSSDATGVAGGSQGDTLSVTAQTINGLVVAISGSSITVDGVTIGSIDGTANGATDTTIGSDATGKSLLITFNANATTARVQAVLQSLQFENGAGTVVEQTRAITVTLRDANGAEETFSTTVEAYNNQRPETADVALNVDEDVTLTLTSANFAFTDGDTGDTLQAVKITELPTAAQGKLQLNGSDIAVNVQITKAQIDAGQLKFVPTADYNGTATFKFTVSDGKQFTLDANAKTATVTIAPVDDAPRITANTGRSYATPMARTILIDPGLALIDPDATGSATGTFADTGTGYLQISITTNKTAGDVLSINNAGTGAGQIGFDGTNITYAGMQIGTIDGTLNGKGNQALKINLNGNASNDAVQALARAVTIRSADQDFGSSSQKTITFTASDGENANTTGATRIVDFADVVFDNFGSPGTNRAVLSFDGTNDKVSMSANSVFQSASNAFTMEGWINTSVNSSDIQTIFSVGSTSGTQSIINSSLSSSSGLSLSGNAVVTGGSLRLTSATNDQSGTATVNPTGNAEGARNFAASFDLKMGESTSSSPADGFSFSYGNGTFVSGGVQEGITDGLTIAFDTFVNDGETVNGIDVILNGDVIRSVTVNGGTRTSKSTHAAEFDGANDVLYRGLDTALHQTGDVTVEAWIKPDVLKNASIVAIGGPSGDGDAPDNNYLYILQITSAGKIEMLHEDSDRDSGNPGANQTVLFDHDAIPVNQWTHVAVSRDISGDGGTYRLYINGQFVDSGTYDYDPDGNGSSAELSIGAELETGGAVINEFSGQIDDVRIWDDVRTSGEISANYDKEITSSGSNLIANYTFDNSLTADESSFDGAQTLTNSGASRVAITDSKIEAEFVTVEIIHNDNGLTVKYDGVTEIANYNLGGNYAPQDSDVFTLAASTGAANDLQAVDNLVITATDLGTRHAIAVQNGKLVFVTEETYGSAAGNAANPTVSDSGTTVAGAWHHVAATHDGNNTLKLYVDGELVQSITGISKNILTGGANIGSSDANSDYFSGLINEIRLWNEERSADEIADTYLPDISSPTGQSTLVGYWKAADVSGSTITDSSSNSNNGSVSGATATTTTTLFAGPNTTEWAVIEGTDTGSENDIAYVDSTTGELVVQNREIVRSADEFKPSSNQPVHVTGTFKFDSGTDGYMHVMTRADPSSTDSNGLPANGLNFSAIEGEDRILIDRFVGGALSANLANSGNGSIDFRKDTEYSFDVYDDGSNIRLTITEVGNPSNTVTVTATDNTDFSGSNYVVLTSREDTDNGDEQVVRFDDVGIDHDIVVDEDGSFTGTLPSTGLSGTLTFAAIGQPEHGTLTITDTATGAYTYTPTSGYHGQDTFTIQVTDANGAINVHQVSFAVEADLDVQVAGKHLNLDGSNDYVHLGTSGSIFTGTGDFTYEAWINPGAKGSRGEIFSVGTASAGAAVYMFVDENGRLEFDVHGEGGPEATSVLTDGDWHHVAATFDASSKTLSLYVDGSLEATQVMTSNINIASGNAYIGSTDNSLTYQGQIDELRIWSEARTAEDIQQNYDQQLSGSETNLAAYYRFDDVQNGTIQDETSNNNDGILGASDTLGDSAEPNVVDRAGGNSLKLDGTDDYVRFTDTYDTGTSFTVETWAWTDPDDTGGHVFSKDSLGSDTAGAANWEIGHGRIAYEKNNANSFSIDPELQAGAWNHYALVVSDQGGGNSEVKIYVNGELIHTATVDTVSVTNGGFLIGRRGFNNDSNFKGQLDDYRVWSTARTADQIAQNYQKTLAGTETGLIAYLTFDGDSSSVSESVSDNTGTLNGGASLVSGSADGSLPPIYGNIIDTPENTSASGYMVTDNSVVGDVTYAINDGAGGTTTSFTTAKNGTVTIDADTGSWTYTPATNYAGSDTFTLVATGATSGSDSETITVNVAGAGDENSVGMPDGILQLDGTGDYITVAHNNALNFGAGQSFTLETWANLNDVTALKTLMDKSTAGDDANYRLSVENGEVFFWSPESGSIDVNFSISTDTWTHIAVTYDADADTMTFYKNGTQVGSPASVSSVGDTNGDSLFIGRDSQGRYVDGQMDEVRIWSDARTADEIEANYQKQLAGNENNLTAYYRFDDDPDGTTVANKATSTGNALDGTLTGDASIRNIPAHAADFSGGSNYIEVKNPTGVITGTGSFTYETWIQTTETTLNTIMGTGGTNGGGATMRINNGIIQFNNTGEAAGTGEVFGTSNVADGLWHHVAVVYDSTTGLATVYVDGVAEAVGDAQVTGDLEITSGNIVVGDSNNHTGNNYGGLIGNTRFWTTARTADEIAGNMNNVLNGDETGLATQYLYDEKDGNTFVDSAGTNNATITGTVNVVDTVPTVQGTAGEIQENATLSGQLSANDVAGTPSYSVAVTGKTTSAADADGRVTVETANGGTVTIDTSSGAWTYKPANNWYGTDSFNLTASGDNSTSDSETISVTVNNDAENSIVINDGVLHTTGAAGTHASGSFGTSTISNTATMEFKVNLSEMTGAIQAMVTVADSDGTGRYLAALKATGELYFFLSNGSGTSDQVDTGIILETDEWYDIATTYDGTTANVYLDGNLVGTKAISGIALPSGDEKIIIGSRYDGATNNSTALFDEVKVWSEARTQEQIRDGIDQPVASGTTNLEAYYKFDDQVSSTAVQDQSGNNRDLTLNGSAKIMDDLKGGLSFDGTDDVVTIADDASLNSAQGTWSTWFKWDTTANPTNGAILMGRHDETSSFNGLLIAVEPDGDVLVQGKDADSHNNAEITVSNPGVIDGAWHQVTVVYDQAAGGLNKVYVDGQLVGSVQSSAAWNWGGQALQIGDSPDTHWTPWKGEIGPVQIYNTKLTDEQVADQFGNEIDPATSGLVGSYDFTEGTGTTAANDATGGTQTPDATVSGATWLDLDNDTTATTLVIQEDEVATGHMLANDVPGTASYSVQTNGQHGTVTMNTDGTWTYKPVENYYGTDTFTLRVSGTDADGTVFNDDQTVTVTINSVDDGNAVQISDGALSLDGTDDWVDLPNTILNASQGTVSMRVNLPADAPTGSFMPLFANRDDGDGDRVYIFAEFTGGQWHLKATLDDKTIDGGVISTGTWYETTLVWRSDNTGEFYIDGDSKGTVSSLSLNAGTNSNVNNGVGLGTYDKASNNQHTKALIDEVSIWSTGKTSSEIRDSVGQQLTGAESNLTAYYRFDDDTDGNVVRDLTGNGNNGTLMNGADIVDPASGSEPSILGNAIEIQTSEVAAGAMTGIDVPGTPTYSIVGGTTTFTTANGGSVTVDASTGAWTYDPANGYYGSDSFTLRAASTSGSVNFTDDETVTVTIKSDTNVEAHDGVLQVDGNNSWANVGDANALDITGDLTLEAWINPQGPGTHNTVGGVIAGKDNAYLLARSPDGSISFALNGPGGTWNWTDTGYDAPLDTWTHLAMTFDGSEQTVKLYANGELAATSTDGIIPTGITSGSGAFAIGGRPAQDEEFEGQIDDVRVWNDLRTADEIRENYDQKLSGSETGLAGYWNFDDVSGNTVQDGTSNNNDATLAGNARVNNTLGASMEFDGNGDYVSTSGVNLANKSFSWEFDAYRDSTANTDLALTSHDGTSGNQHFFHAGYLDGNTFRYSFNQASGNYRIDYTDTTGPNGNGTDVWNHWAGTYDAESNVARLYLNGELVVTEVFDGDFLGTASLFIASTDPAQSTGHYFDGKLDNVRVWDGVRTGEEIQENYNTVLTGDQDGKLLANYTFEETSGSTVTNTANSGTYDGTAVGDYNRVDVSPNNFTNTITIEENEVVQGNMNSAGADGSATFSADATNAHGTVTINASTGRWTYTPHENYHGSASFVLTATGANGTTDSETINVTINADAAQRSPVSNTAVLVLDGTNDYVAIADNASLDMAAGQSFTLEAWINTSSVTGISTIIDKAADNADDPNYRLAIIDGKLDFWTPESGNVNSGALLTTNEWTHVAVSYDAATDQMTFYLNGDQAGEVQTVTSIGDVNAGPLHIGTDSVGVQGGDRFFDGMIDDVRIWRDVRTSDEIRDNIDQQVASNADNLAGNWIFDGSNGTTVEDRTSNSNDGTLTNGAEIKSPPTNAIELDGANDFISAGDLGSTFNSATIETWLKLDSLASGLDVLFISDGTWSNGDAVAQFNTSNGQLFWSEHTGGGGVDVAFDEFDFRTVIGEWVHVAIVKDKTEGTIKLMIDGEIVSAKALPASLASSTFHMNDARIGGWSTGDPRTIDGQLADFRVWNTARTDQQIADNYNTTLSGNEGGALVANYQFKDTSGQTVTDSAGDNDGTLGANNATGTDDPTYTDATPQIHTLSVAIQENHTASGTMTANDVVPTGAVFGVNSTNAHSGTTSLTIANKGTVAIDSSTGDWTFTPVDNFNGEVQFYLTASGDGLTDAEQITVTIQPVNVTSNEINATSAVFDGTDDALSTTVSGMQVSDTGSFTIETWFKTTQSDSGILIDLGEETPDSALRLFLNNGTLALAKPGSVFAQATSVTVNDGNWHHTSVTYDGSTNELRLYVDGELVNSVESLALDIDNGDVTLGDYNSSTGNTLSYDGQLSDVRLWSTARSSEEIRENYTHKLAGNETGLQAYYTFEDRDGTSVNDVTSNNNDLKPESDAASPTYSDGGLDLLANSISIEEDTTATGTMTASDVVGTASYSVTAAAQHGTVSINATTGEWTYTPGVNYSGTDTFQLQATDGTFTDQETISVTIDADNDPSIAGSVLQGSGGSTDYGTIEGINIANKSFSVELWAYRASDTTSDVILSQGTAATRNGLHLGYRDGNGGFDNKQFTFAFYNDDLDFTDSDTNVGEWVHWAATFDNATKEAILYKNGVQVATKTMGGSYTGTGDMWVGTDVQKIGSLNGMTDDIRIWDDVRTADEIASNYNHQLAGNESNLIAYYAMESADGKIIGDKTSNNRDITLNDSAGINVVNLPVSAMNFDGNDDYVQVANTSDFNASTWSVEAWFNTTTAHAGGSDYGQIVSKSVSGKLQYAIGMANGKLSLFTNNTTDSIYLETTDTYNDGTWHHVSGVYDGTNLNLYVDGQLLRTQAFSGTIATDSNPLTIGAREETGDPPWQHFTGQIADVRVWSDGRTADEITANYNHALTGNEDGLVANYKFEEIDGTTVSDSSTNSNNGTANGGPTIVDPRPDIQGNTISLSTADTASGTMAATDVTGAATFTISDQPDNGTVSLNADTGDWTYTPNANYIGADSFTVRSTGATSGTDDETITLTITAATEATVSPTQSALQFDGVDDYMNIGPMSENISGAYTMEAWVYYNPAAFTDNNWMRIIDLGQGENDDNLLLAIDPGSDVFSFDTRNGGVSSSVKSDTTAPTGQWVHVAGVNDGAGNGYLYIDGELVKTETGQQVAQDVVRLNNYIGQSNWDGESPMHGAVADVRIWNDARTSDEIKANYDKTLAGSEDSLVAYYTFEGIENGIVRDITNNNNDAQIITNSNDPGVAATGPTGDVLRLNGTDDGVVTAVDAAVQLTGDVTYEAWIRPDSLSTRQGLLSIAGNTNTDSSTENMLFHVELWNGNVRVMHEYGAGGPNRADNQFTNHGITQSEWNHIAITRDVSEQTYELFVNGVSIGTYDYGTAGASDPDGGSNANLTIGAMRVSAGDVNSIAVGFDGDMDNVRVWDTVRNAEDIRDGMSTSYDFDTTNLVAQYTFDDIENGTTVLDGAHSMTNGVRSNDNNGTLVNDATAADSGSGGGVAVSHLDKAIRFDGTNDSASDPSDTIAPLGANERTIMLWARSSSEEPQTFVSYGTGTQGQQFIFGLNSWDEPEANIEGGKGITIDVGSGAITFQPLTGTDDGQWHHYAVVLPSDGDSLRDLRVYQDGVLLTTISALYNNGDVTIDTQTSAFQLGHHGTSRYFNGDMAEVSVWSAGLTAAQINEYMNEQLSGAETGLSGYWRGSDNGSGAVKDYTGNNDLTLNDGASIVDVAPDVTANSIRITEDTIATGQLNASGTNTSATYTVQTAAGNGTVTIDSATGVWNYVPNAGYAGTDTFTLRAAGTETEQETISVRIGQDPVLPSSYALSLDGSDDYVDVGPLSDDISGAFTAEAWIKLDANAFTGTQWMRIFDFSETTGANNNGFLLTTNGTSGELALYTYSGNAATAVTADDPLPLNEWVHVAAVNDGAGNATLYLNGAAIKTGTGQNALASSTKVYNYLGKSQDSNDTNFKGDIAEARLWNDARTSTEIADSYDKQLNGDEQGLAGYWTFEEGAGSIANDQSGNGNDATIVGGTHENMTTISMSAGATYKGLILGADADSNDTLSYSVSSAANGTLNLDTDGSFEYTNSTNDDDSFDVTITDSDGNQTVETIHIDVP